VTDSRERVFLLVLIVVGGSYGVFLSAILPPLFFLRACPRPQDFLIAIFGSTNKDTARLKLNADSFWRRVSFFLGSSPPTSVVDRRPGISFAQFQLRPTAIVGV